MVSRWQYNKIEPRAIKGQLDGQSLTRADLEIKKELKVLDFLADGKVRTLKELKALVAPYDLTYTLRNLLKAEVIERVSVNRYRLTEVEVERCK